MAERQWRRPLVSTLLFPSLSPVVVVIYFFSSSSSHFLWLFTCSLSLSVLLLYTTASSVIFFCLSFDVASARLLPPIACVCRARRFLLTGRIVVGTPSHVTVYSFIIFIIYSIKSSSSQRRRGERINK